MSGLAFLIHWILILKLLIMSQVIYTSFYIFNSLLVHRMMIGVSSGRIRVSTSPIRVSTGLIADSTRSEFLPYMHVCAILVLRDV